MASNYSNSKCNDQLGLCSDDDGTQLSKPHKKPIEIYTFVDPLCPECWALEPILKKLQMEYCDYFTIRYLIGGKLQSWNANYSNKDLAKAWEKTASRTGMSCDGDLWLEDPIDTPFIASIAIKAAELQGKQIGIKYLRKIRELLFLDKQNIAKEEILIDCAKNINGMCIDEFVKDLRSEGSIKAFQCDIKTTKEMGAEYFPTIVFFNDNIEEEGLMITGLHDYHVYVKVLTEMLGEVPVPNRPLFLEDFLKHYSFVATKEIAVVYDLTCEEVEKEMKKLLLLQKVERVPVKFGTFWRYTGK